MSVWMPDSLAWQAQLDICDMLLAAGADINHLGPAAHCRRYGTPCSK